jgi:hypothetical protein
LLRNNQSIVNVFIDFIVVIIYLNGEYNDFIRPAHNSTYTQVGVQYFYESEVLNQSSVLLMKFSARNPHLRVAAKRYGVFLF